MGNCSLKGATVAETSKSVQIMTDSGEVIALPEPKSVGEVVCRFPAGYGIFKKGQMSLPLCEDEQLVAGQSYFLFRLDKDMTVKETEPVKMSPASSAAATAAAMGSVKNVPNVSAIEVLPPPRKGVWSVKLAIGTKQLEEILSQEVKVEALIEEMRMAASCAGASPGRRGTKSSLGAMGWKPFLTSVFKAQTDYKQEMMDYSCAAANTSPNAG